MKIMKVNDFCNRLIEYEKKPTLYKLGTFMNRYKGKYLLCDCSGLIKGTLWGYPTNGRYASNGIPDANANTIISKYCRDVTSDFSKLKKGMAVWMNGHIGVYVGDGIVIESSPKWENGIQRTYPRGCPISNKHKLNTRTWSKCGYLKWIDYWNPSTKPNITEVAKDVIKGKYGNGKERIDNLKRLGYNYEEVQKEVNRLLK